MSQTAFPGPHRNRVILTRLVYLLGAAALVVALILTRSPGGAATPATLDIHTTGSGVSVDPPQLTVDGVGQVTGIPDTLTVTLDVDTQAASASAALSRNESETAALISTLTGSGVSQGDIQTTDLYINPDYSGNSISGYEVDETITVTLHDLTKAGGIIDAASRSVGNDIRIEGMSLSFADDSTLMAQARQAAMADAQTKASQLAAGAGTSLGPIVSVTEQTNSDQTPYPMAAAGVAGSSLSVPVQAGTQQVSVTVTVVYQLGS
ncbi:MAG TPA: SIMPL domain-containing protein [Candidatus Binatia bacterium]|nr:SIMPL domain-containing protein [Candidatus Binatia bacterium]